MKKLSDHIKSINEKNEKALSVFLTAGYPFKETFTDLALGVLEAGADMIEIGFPFSDPLADGPVIQYSSSQALRQGVNIKTALEYSCRIKSKTEKPVILMGYSNPILSYGAKDFFLDAANSGVSGLIIPDVPPEEYDSFFLDNTQGLDVIMLSTPDSPEVRIEAIDNLSRGFVYCVSVNGTTGERSAFSSETLNALERSYSIIKKNRMLAGFGISNCESIKAISPFCDGVIVGSAIIKKLLKAENNKDGFNEALELVRQLKSACIGAGVL